MARTSKRIRREWASLSAIAGAAVAASSGGAYATTVFSHGPNLSLPVDLPGGDMIATTQRGTGVSSTDSGFLNSFAYAKATHQNVHLLSLAGPTLAPARKGQIFNPVGAAGVLEIAAKTSRYFKFGARAGATTSRETIAKIKARVTRFPFHFRGPYTNFFQLRSGYFFQSGQPVGFYETVTRSGSRELFGFGADQYAAFRFDVDGQSDYGWLEYDVTNQQHGPPQFQLLAYAYNTDGSPMPAGFIPEPRNLPLALSALSLGAIGVREWRKSRRKSANA